MNVIITAVSALGNVQTKISALPIFKIINYHIYLCTYGLNHYEIRETLQRRHRSDPMYQESKNWKMLWTLSE